MDTVLTQLAEQIDTRFEDATSDYRALIVVNPSETSFTGPAVLDVCVPLKPGRTPRKASAWDTNGMRVPCQIRQSSFEPLTGSAFPEGSQLWRFELWFWVDALPPHSYATYRSEWSDDELPLPESAFAIPPLRAVKESLPHTGTLPKVGILPQTE